MLFNSLHFLLFFPVICLVYFRIPSKLKNYWLLIASCYFYLAFNPAYIFLMMFIIAVTYASGIIIEKYEKQKKITAAAAVIICIFILGFFKYYNFFTYFTNNAFGIFGINISFPSFDFIMPLGISFYTFQAISYTVDVYRKKTEPLHNFAGYALFVSFFPNMVSGPIQKSHEFLPQLKKSHLHRFNYDRVKNGLILMLWGFFCKMVVADRLAIAVNAVFDAPGDFSGLQIFVSVILFSIQIFIDFNSYSDIAIGASRILGFDFKSNFLRPYFSKSIKEFWRRWHISLSSWFRDYLYFPLGGNRKGKTRTYINTMVVFIVSGLWHGASGTFILWGTLHGSFLIIGQLTETLRRKILPENSKIRKNIVFRTASVLFVFSLVSFSWIFFRANSFDDSLTIIKNAFDFSKGLSLWQLFALKLSANEFFLCFFGIGLIFLINLYQCKHSIDLKISQLHVFFRWLIYIAFIMAIIIFGIYGTETSQQFIYVQF